jgi:hypothetical protein
MHVHVRGPYRSTSVLASHPPLGTSSVSVMPRSYMMNAGRSPLCELFDGTAAIAGCARSVSHMGRHVIRTDVTPNLA